jgi:fatty acid-binding protein DegV
LGRKIGIVTDTIADIPENLIKALGIHVFPTSIVRDGKPYRDGIGIEAEDFYPGFSPAQGNGLPTGCRRRQGADLQKIDF